MKLSQHFSLWEAERSMTAIRHGINNTVPSELIPNVTAVAQNILEPIREQYGISFSPTSWYRCPYLNQLIGGSSTSQHMLGQAVDVELPTISNINLAHWCVENLEFDQLILEFYRPGEAHSGWVHISHRADGTNRRRIRTLINRQYSVGLPE